VRLSIAEPADLEAVTALINLAFRVERFFIDTDGIHICDRASVLISCTRPKSMPGRLAAVSPISES
jgi:hypothetical protein